MLADFIPQPVKFLVKMLQRADYSAYMKQVKSDLFRESAEMDFVRLFRQMNIVDRPDEFVRPKNVGLMFFNDEPSQFFPQTLIDVVHFPEGPGADSFTEKTFFGPLHLMLQDALSHIHSMVTEEKEVKRLLLVVTGDHSRKELQSLLGLKNADYFRKAYLLPAINAGLAEMTLPDKPNSRLQQYRLTETGKSFRSGACNDRWSNS